MKLYIISETIQKKLPFIAHAISNKSQLPILLHFLLEAKTEGLSISSTDLEIGIKTTFPAIVEEEGSTTVPAKQFLELLSTLTADKVLLETQGASLIVSSSKTRNTFQTTSKEEFPTLYEEKGIPLINLPKEAFQNDFPKVVFAASVDMGRPALSGIYIKKQEAGFLMVATDGYRLSLKQYRKQAVSLDQFEKPLLIPARVFKEAAVMKEEGDIQISISTEKNQVIFEQDKTTLVGRLIDAEFPPYEKIIPQDHATSVSFDREELQKAVKICSIFAREAANIIRFSIKTDKIIVSSNATTIGENKVEVEAVLTGEENDIAFNGRYVLDVLSNISENDMVFEMSGPLNPGVFKVKNDDTFLHLIMPIRVQA